MSSKDKLIIHKLHFDIEVDSKDDFKHYADRISRLINGVLPSRLQSLFKKHKLPEGNLIVKQLSIDLGRIDVLHFEKAISDAILWEIDSFIAKNIKNIKHEVQQSQFKVSIGGKYEIQSTDFIFESEIIIPQSVHLTKEIQIKTAELVNLTDISLPKEIVKRQVLEAKSIKKSQRKVEKSKGIFAVIEEHIDLTKVYKNISKSVEQKPVTTIVEKEKDQIATQKTEETELIDLMDHLQDKLTPPTPDKINKPELSKKKAKIKEDTVVQKKKLSTIPKNLTPLDKALIYYLKYGRLPSNVKYQLGTSMVDVLNINQQDEAFLDELAKRIEHDPKAKERLVRLIDQTRKDPEFDPRIPRAFEDYFAALIHNIPTNQFSAGIQRFNLNDLIRFIYADNPNKLKHLIRFLIMDYESGKKWSDLVDNLFDRISKPSVVKLISSFARKGAYLNKALNELNRANGNDAKSAHKELFKLLISGGDTNVFDFEIRPRIYFKEDPEYKVQTLTDSQIVDYYLSYDSIPYSVGINMDIDTINVLILMLSPSQISRLSFFKNERNINYETVGNLSEKAITQLIKSINPNIEDEIKSSFLHFNLNIEGGIPESFQKAFMLFYALKKNRKSYLEEMINYWKEQMGDADNVIRSRWKVTNDLSSELNKLLTFTSKKITDEIKVDYEFQSYSKDISVKNGGLVILWPFLKVYFNMLGLLNQEGNFRSMTERARACHLLQYLAIQRSYGEEFYYPLNKILTGYPLDEPLPYEITMTKKEIDVSNALLKNVITQWNALRGGTVDGLRGSFLIRDGILVPTPNGWLLTVETKAYDILMDKLPWGIGMIKLSWAPYILNVEWERKFM
jgi:hypothetical protein